MQSFCYNFGKRKLLLMILLLLHSETNCRKSEKNSATLPQICSHCLTKSGSSTVQLLFRTRLRTLNR